MSFENFNLDSRIMSGVASAGFIDPTPVQSQTIPAALEGRDVMGLAQTGTGKTAAFVLPMLQRLINGQRGRVRGLIIAPTRELAEQTNEAIRELGGKTRLKSMTLYGGVAMNPQLKRLSSGVDIIVACPGRLLDHMQQGSVDISTVEMLVLDEADRMLDMGFMPDVKRILKKVPKNRQTLLFSATMPDDIRVFASQIMRNPLVVQINHSQPVKTVSHELYPVEAHLKTSLLIRLLKKDADAKSVLVFTRTRMRAKRVADQLQRAGFRVTAIQGSMPQSKRQAALNGFRDGKYQILVATDIAARGVDVLSISHVVNYDMPDTADSYTHRIGRTGRMARTGKACTLVTKDDSPAVRAFERVMDVELICCELDDFDYSTPAPAPGAFSRRRNGGNGMRQGSSSGRTENRRNHGGPPPAHAARRPSRSA